ncbi:MAG TPA: zf-HC2 domain-containing protein [Symbiobacteriaceae bacterium]
MMKCSDDLIQMYVEGTLQPVEAAIVEAHLKECHTCRSRVGFYKGLFWDLSRSDVLAPPDGLDETEVDALAGRLQAEWQRGRSRAPAGTAALATLWLTTNPVARAAGSAVLSALEATASLGFGALSRAGRLLLRRKGGGRR